eukprot:949264-Pelagomonas_calceolata.AAC.2
MVSVAGTVTLLGFLGMFHVMFAVIKHREMLKLLQEDMESMPPALLVELIVAASCAVAGAPAETWLKGEPYLELAAVFSIPDPSTHLVCSFVRAGAFVMAGSLKSVVSSKSSGELATQDAPVKKQCSKAKKNLVCCQMP